MSCDFKVMDYAGRTIGLEHANWEKHQPRHPEVVPYHDAIPLALSEPHLVIDLGDQRHYYRFGIGEGKLAGTALRVVVGATNGIVRTVHFARRVDFSRGIIELDRLDQVDR